MNWREMILKGVAIILFVGGVLGVSVGLAELTSLERKNLRAFNRINETDYTIAEWRVYSYEIKKLYPLTIKNDNGGKK